MDSKSIVSGVQPGEVQCILCADIINFNKGNHQDKFFGHMKNHHKVSVNHILLFGIHFMDDHSVGQIIDNFKQDYYDIINTDNNDSDSFEDKNLFNEEDQDIFDNQLDSSEQNISAYVKTIVEYPPETCDECGNEFNVHYKKCMFHRNIFLKRNYDAINEPNFESDRLSSYDDLKHTNRTDKNSPTETDLRMHIETTNIEEDLKILRSRVAAVKYMKIIDIAKSQMLGKVRDDDDKKLLNEPDQMEDFSIENVTSSPDDGTKNRDDAVKQKIKLMVGLTGERLWHCTDCDYYHKTKANVTTHIETKHLDEKVYCKICEMSFTATKYLKRHLIHRHKENEKHEDHESFNGQIEDFNMNDRLNELEQTENASMVSSSFSANTQSDSGTVATFRNGDGSKNEYTDDGKKIDLIAEDSYDDKNKKRDEAIKQKMTLGVGLNGERLWHCNDCDYSQKKKTNIMGHIERKHLDEKVFCKLCKMLFSTRNYLEKHLNDSIHKKRMKLLGRWKN